ncbi:ABC transporter ATP-binding protein [Peptoniphilaceae bacterium SGI.137]|nr:ABC transporter ATP-binding protein [Peptoniphilaceae bacterium]MCI6659355.1 ABC transporter ATP-binding protein [Peptoniphilaceae bacterium]MDD7543350.1 ABC transporter ATP-binding protein [Peptoniphilaceae bacterium]MDY4196291.1 ABC transporter ATP-binding protein [Peptoniphilaceae bacterium]MDY5765852.1 ABC transporter ATP-binding protein [Peptoniphilaceae bacterium]
MSFIEVKELCKYYKVGENTIAANRDISFTIEKNEFVFIIGPSGAGKSTLLNILGGMDTASSGEALIDGKNLTRMNERELTRYRREDMGFVFQFYNLIENLTARENVELSTHVVKNALDPETILRDLGLENRINSFPSQLSGGEQQRVSIARALAKKPKLLLCDEPTGALDYLTGKQVLKILKRASRETDATVIVITHNTAVAPIADKVIHIVDARVKGIEVNPHPVSIDSIEW